MNILKKYLCIILFACTLFTNIDTLQTYAIPNIQLSNNGSSISNGLNTNNDLTYALDKVLGEYRGAIVFLSGIGLISMIMFFIFNLIELGNSKGNPQARQKAIHGLILSGLGTAGLGSVTLFVSLFYNMI